MTFLKELDASVDVNSATVLDECHDHAPVSDSGRQCLIPPQAPLPDAACTVDCCTSQQLFASQLAELALFKHPARAVGMRCGHRRGRHLLSAMVR
jgi:hypothetical protein